MLVGDPTLPFYIVLEWRHRGASRERPEGSCLLQPGVQLAWHLKWTELVTQLCHRSAPKAYLLVQGVWTCRSHQDSQCYQA